MRTRHLGSRIVVTMLAALAVAACSDNAPVAPPATHATADVVGGGSGRRHLIVMRDSSASLTNVIAQVEALGGAVLRADSGIGVITTTGLTDGAVAALAGRADVDGVARDTVMQMIPPVGDLSGQLVHAQTDQSGAFFFPTFQWNLRQIKADKAWLVTNQGQGALVCILDSGVDPNHLDLAGKVDLGISTSFVAAEPDVLDHNFHGTFVSALVSSNGIGMASVAPDARLCMVKVLGASGRGSFVDLISGIMYAAVHHADVINMSLGALVTIQSRDDLELLVALQRAINFARRHGTLAVAAAGNEAVNLATAPPNEISIPAEIPGVISAGATAPVGQQNFDRIASYSEVGFPGVDVFAPGGDFVTGSVIQDLIFSACAETVPGCENGRTYVLAAGTSFASPEVAGEAAVIESDIPRDQRAAVLESCIELTTDHPTGLAIDPLYGFGRIDVLNAAACVKNHGNGTKGNAAGDGKGALIKNLLGGHGVGN